MIASIRTDLKVIKRMIGSVLAFTVAVLTLLLTLPKRREGRRSRPYPPRLPTYRGPQSGTHGGASVVGDGDGGPSY
jgi:hypothetical protein